MGDTTKSQDKWEEEWNIEKDLEALVRADAVNADPERLKKAKALAKKKVDENKRRRDEAQALVNLGEGKNL